AWGTLAHINANPNDCIFAAPFRSRNIPIRASAMEKIGPAAVGQYQFAVASLHDLQIRHALKSRYSGQQPQIILPTMKCAISWASPISRAKRKKANRFFALSWSFTAVMFCTKTPLVRFGLHHCAIFVF